MRNTHTVDNGIGYGDDLKICLSEGYDGAWVPQVEAGAFFLDGRPRYLFASEGTQDVAVPLDITGGEILSGSYAVLTELSQPTRQGPILLASTRFDYTRCVSPLALFRAATPVVYDTTLLTIDVAGELVSLTGADSRDLRRVPTTDQLTERDQLWWDSANRKVWIRRDAADPLRLETLWLSYLQDIPALTQEEIVLVDSDGKVRVLYDRVIDSTITIAGPNVPGGSCAGTSTPAGGSVITPGTALVEGLRVAVRYRIDGSFLVCSNPSGAPEETMLLTCSTVAESATVRWEQADRGSALDGYWIDLNPLRAGTLGGFLYMSGHRLPYERARIGSIELTPERVRIDTALPQPLRLVLRVLGPNGDPTPNVPVRACHVTGPDAAVTPLMALGSARPGQVWTDPGSPTPPAESSLDNAFLTDYAGRCHLVWMPPVSGGAIPSGDYTAQAQVEDDLGVVTTATAVFHALATAYRAVGTASWAGIAKALLYLNPNPDAQGFQDLYVRLMTMTGTPYPDPISVQISSENGLLFAAAALADAGTQPGAALLTLTFDDTTTAGLLRSAVCRYLRPATGPDRIVAKALPGSGPQLLGAPLRLG